MAQHFKLRYSGSKIWLIFWTIIFFPVALTLVAVQGRFESSDRSVYLKYDGSVFWLGFWALIFFPIALLLLALNGVTFVKEDLPSDLGFKKTA